MKLALILAAALFAPAVRAQAPAKPRKKKPAAAKPKKKAAESRYKTTLLADGVDAHYRYDEAGNPIDAKKPAPGAKKKAPSSERDDDAATGLKTNDDADSL